MLDLNTLLNWMSNVGAQLSIEPHKDGTDMNLIVRLPGRGGLFTQKMVISREAKFYYKGGNLIAQELEAMLGKVERKLKELEVQDGPG